MDIADPTNLPHTPDPAQARGQPQPSETPCCMAVCVCVNGHALFCAAAVRLHPQASMSSSSCTCKQATLRWAAFSAALRCAAALPLATRWTETLRQAPRKLSRNPRLSHLTLCAVGRKAKGQRQRANQRGSAVRERRRRRVLVCASRRLGLVQLRFAGVYEDAYRGKSLPKARWGVCEQRAVQRRECLARRRPVARGGEASWRRGGLVGQLV